jgi:AcrR family transcriptional regulator
LETGYSGRVAWDTENTKRRIREAAVAEFAAHGPAARVDQIAARAGVNKERMYAYYGTKDQLFATVLHEELSKLAAAVSLDSASARDLGEYAGRAFDYHSEHPELLRLLHWEGLRWVDGATPEDSERSAYYARKVAAIAEAQAAGAIAADPDAARLLYAVIALAAWWFAAPQVVRMLLGAAADDREAQRIALVALVRRIAGVEPVG